MKKAFVFIFFLSLIGFQSNAQISATDSVEVTGTNDYDGHCRGFDFIPKTDIYIQEFGKRVPNTTGNYTWVIWEVNTQTKIYEQNSILSAATTYIYEFSDSIIKLDSGITYSMCNTCTPSTFPTIIHAQDYHYGTPDFIFECYTNAVSIIDTACISYTSPSGNHVWTTSGIYNDTIERTGICDSIVIVNLLIKTVDTSVVKSGATLTANATGASYQWINCDSLTPMIGDTFQVFNATINGNYAVIVSENGCTDTSSCYTITSAGIENNIDNTISIYPNPTTDNFVITLDKTYNEIVVQINNTLGEIVFEKTYHNTKKMNIELNEKAGVYFVSVHYDAEVKSMKLIKN